MLTCGCILSITMLVFGFFDIVYLKNESMLNLEISIIVYVNYQICTNCHFHKMT